MNKSSVAYASQSPRSVGKKLREAAFLGFRIAFHATCVVTFCACFGSTSDNKKKPVEKPPQPPTFTLSGGDDADRRFANEALFGAPHATPAGGGHADNPG